MIFRLALAAFSFPFFFAGALIRFAHLAFLLGKMTAQNIFDGLKKEMEAESKKR